LNTQSATEGSAPCLVSRNGSVLELAINRPAQRNALNYDTVTELLALLRQADADPGVNVVLLHGDGPCFCAGGDLAEFEQGLGQSALAYHETGAVWSELMTVVPELRVPVVVAAHRYALAGGMGIVAASDVAIASHDTQFGMPEVRIGLFPSIIFGTVAGAIGHRSARELALTARRIDAAEALRLGLVHRLVAPEDLLRAAREAAQEMAGFGADVLRLGKELMRSARGLSVPEATTLGKAMRGAFMETEDFHAGVARFKKRL
jgi:enoyl-CoA hydratase/carnithine racemase